MKKYIIILLTLVAIGFSSCEKWLDVNHNPNDATKASPDLVLPGVLTTWASNVNALTPVMSAWMGYWVHAGGWSGWYSEKKYEITSSYLSNTDYFNGYYYGPLNDTKFIRANAGTNKAYPAITDVVDAWYYSRLVDMYGDVPYTEACSADKTLTPKYDAGSDIYADLITRLDNAIKVFHDAQTLSETDADYAIKNTSDILFGGDFEKWETFANTLKLRLVMHMSNVKTAAELKAMMDNTINSGFITENVTATPGYQASSGKTNPLWNTFGKSFDGVKTNQNTQYVLNKYFHTKLLGLSDPRLNKFFFAPPAAAGVLKSFVLGTDGDLTAQPNSTQAANYSWVLIAADASVSAGVVNGNGALDKTVMFLLSEAEFLQAEAALRGVIASPSAQAAYTAGVTTALTQAKVAAADITTYLAQANVAWDNAASTAAKLERIMDQKYIANYFLNVFETYNDYRRTNLPKAKGLGSDAEMLSYYPSGIIRRQIPRIFPYPNEEFTLNTANVQAAVAKTGVQFTTSLYPFDARVFWDNAPLVITY